MPKRSPKGDVRTAASVSSNTASSSTVSASAPNNSTALGEVSRSSMSQYPDAFLHILTRDDGWLRVVPQEMGSVTFYKWKFTRGPWTGYYVMYRSDDLDFIAAIVGLYRKLLRVDTGAERPVYDTPYNF